MTVHIDNPWVPDSCTLPTAQRPLRVAEFDALFVTSLRAQHRTGTTRLHWVLDPTAEERVRDLIARETGCCSFFRFSVAAGPDAVRVDLDVPDAHADVLDALAARAASAAGPRVP